MSARYASLLDEWREACAATRDAQKRVSHSYELHLQGNGQAPTDADLAHLARLRNIENTKLQAALEYVKSTASGPPTGWGSP